MISKKLLIVSTLLAIALAPMAYAATVFAPYQEGTGTATSGYVLTSNGTSSFASWQAPASTTPGGSNTQIQFNDSSAFGGSAKLTFNKTSGDVIMSTGHLRLGGTDGSAVVDVAGAGLVTQGLRIEGSAATAISFSTYVTGDPFIRFTFLSSGQMEWGSGTLVADTNLYRSAADTLKTDDAFIVVGHTTFEGVTSTGATGSGKLVYSISPTFTGTVTIPTPFTLGAISVTSTGTQLNYLSSASGTTGTTSTNLVFSTSPVLTTPNIGAATATSINGLVVTTTLGTLTIPNNVSAALITSGNFSITLTATGTTAVTLPTSGTLVSSVTTGNGVSATNTAGALAFTLGAITPTTVNGNTFTTGTYTLTGQAGKTLTFNGSITLTGTDAQTYTFPTTSATMARTDAGQTFTGVNTFTSPKLITDLSDTNGNEVFKITATGSAVNEFTIANAATGNNPTITASGETNVGLVLSGKGTRGVIMNNAMTEKVSTVTDGAGAVIDASLGNVYTWSAAADRTAGTTTNPTAGQKMVIEFTASGGARTLTLPTATTGDFRFGSDITALTQTASGKTDYIGVIYNGTAARWDIVAVTKGF